MRCACAAAELFGFPAYPTRRKILAEELGPVVPELLADQDLFVTVCERINSFEQLSPA